MIDIDNQFTRGKKQPVLLSVGEYPGGRDIGQQVLLQLPEPFLVVQRDTCAVRPFP